MSQDFRDLLAAFNDHDVEFLLVGAHALAAYGRVRATKDLEFWIRPEPRNAARTLAALRDFGAPLLDLTEQDFAGPGVTFQIGLPPLRIALPLCELRADLVATPWRRTENNSQPTDEPTKWRRVVLAALLAPPFRGPLLLTRWVEQRAKERMWGWWERIHHRDASPGESVLQVFGQGGPGASRRALGLRDEHVEQFSERLDGEHAGGRCTQA